MNSHVDHRQVISGIGWVHGLQRVGALSAILAVASATAVPRAEGAGEQACCNLSTSDRRCFDDIIASGSTCSSPATGLGKGTTCVNDCDCDTVCDDCAGKQAGNLSHVEIMHVGTSFNGTNTTFTYRVCQIVGAALSHWVLGLSNVCCNQIVGATGGSTTGSCGTDPPTGMFGLKFETGSGVTSCSGICGSAGTIFTITISGNVGDTGCVKTANKADGAEDTSTACIRGPDATCSEGNACDPPPDCSPFNTECTTFSCDPNGSAGNCSVATNDPSGTPCEADGDLCTNDACNGSGMCVFVSDKNALCPPPTEFCDGGSKCNPATGACEANPDKPFSTVCERDGNLCTNDHCDGLGHCVLLSDKSLTCADPVPPCEGGETCNPATGVCEPNPDAALSTSCEADGDLCTIDHCDGFGNCVNFDNVMCAVAVPPCEGGAVCDPATGACVDQPDAAFSTFCERGDPLNLCTRDHCDGNGNCVLLSNVVCQGSSQCDPGENCDPATGNCVMKPDIPPFSTPCEEDGDLCTNEHCDGAGNCVFLSIKGCPPPTGFCDGGTNCDPATGACSIPKPDRPFSTPCERDGNLCTNDHCDGMGNCVFLSDKNATCPPDTTCQTFDCDTATGLCVGTPQPESTPCEADSPPDLCKVDHCDGLGNCVFFFNVMCSPPLGPCDGGENCNPMNGLCEPKPDKEFSTFCERGDPLGLCTNDHCDGIGNCVFLNEKMCPLPDPPCEAGANCDPANGMCVDKLDPPLSTFCETDTDACTRQHCDGSGNCVLEKEICGACCDSVTGICMNDLFEVQCVNIDPDDQFTWYQGLLCSQIPPPGCVRHTGACCDFREKLCIDGVFPEDCPEPGRTWVKGATCASNPCESFHCGPGPHWIDTCPGGIDYLDGTQVLAAIDLNLDPCCVGDVVLALDGNVAITRSGALDDSAFYPGTRPVDGHLDVIDTEIVSMTLTGGGATMTVGGGFSPGGKPLARSFGTIAERVGDPTLGDSFFDVFFAIDLGGGLFIYNHDAVRVEAVLVKVPPKAVNYIHAVQCVPLFTNPVGGIHVANLSEAAHCVGGGCPPDLFQGACCDPEQPGGLCTDGLLREGCCGGQKFFTRGASCAEVKCNEHVGACCDMRIADPVLRCQDNVPASLCPIDDPRQMSWWKGQTCAAIECPEHTGACCDKRIADPALRCRDGLTQSQCIIDDPTQVSWTKSTLCADLEPPCTEHTGACCDRRIPDPALRCRDGVPASQCIIDDPTQVSWTKFTLCADLGEPCAEHTGACCDMSLPDGACRSRMLPRDCDTTNPQIRWYKDLLCIEDGGQVDCLEHTGACCDQRIPDPMLRCRDDVPESLCPIDDPRQVQWYKDTDCSAIVCPEHTGACCDEDPFGDCRDNVPASQCNCKKCEFYKDTPCEEIECVHNAIPTMSQWGLAVLTLLLLIGAKVYFGRRPVEAA